jgi:putative nucleotide binding protein
MKVKEEYAWVLDYLPYGSPDDSRPVYKKRPVVHAIGEKKFVLIEAVPKSDKVPEVHKRTYIGEGPREEIDHVKRQLRYDELTHGAKIELPHVLEEIVKKGERRFLDIYNKSYPISTKMHMLELLPGIGKKTMWAILGERKKGDFSSFDDLSARIKISHPEKIIARRIEEELKDEHIKYNLFTQALRDDTR